MQEGRDKQFKGMQGAKGIFLWVELPAVGRDVTGQVGNSKMARGLILLRSLQKSKGSKLHSIN